MNCCPAIQVLQQNNYSRSKQYTLKMSSFRLAAPGSSSCLDARQQLPRCTYICYRVSSSAAALPSLDLWSTGQQYLRSRAAHSRAGATVLVWVNTCAHMCCELAICSATLVARSKLYLDRSSRCKKWLVYVHLCDEETGSSLPSPKPWPKPIQNQGNEASERGCGERLKQVHWRPASQLCRGLKFNRADAFDISSSGLRQSGQLRH